MTLLSNPESIGIQGYETLQEQFPIYTDKSYTPIIPDYDSRNIQDELAFMITGNISAIIRGQRNPLMVRYHEIQFDYRGESRANDTSCIYKFDVAPYLEQSKIIAYGLTFDADEFVMNLSIHTADVGLQSHASVSNADKITIYEVGDDNRTLKRVTSVA